MVNMFLSILPRHSFTPCLSVSIQPSVLALSLLRQEIEAVQSEDMLEIAYHIQRHLKVNTRTLLHNNSSREGK